MLIAIITILGFLSVRWLSVIRDEADRLAGGYTVTVRHANDIERSFLLTMYSMARYVSSGKERFLAESRKWIQDTARSLDSADKLTETKGFLADQKGMVRAIQNQTKKYKDLVDETERRQSSIRREWAVLDEAAAVYMKHGLAFLQIQSDLMEKQIRTDPEPEGLLDRLRKIGMIDHVIHLGDTIRIAANKSQARNDPAIIDNTLGMFAEIRQNLADLRTISIRKDNLEQIDSILAALAQYEKALITVQGDWTRLRELETAEEELRTDLLASSRKITDNGEQRTDQVLAEAQAGLSRAGRIMSIGLVLAIVIGLALALVVTRAITRPIMRLIALTKRVEKGDLSAGLEVIGKDEIGMLMRAFNNMIGANRTIVKSIIDNSTRLSTSSNEIAATIEEISRGAEFQSNDIIKTSTAMDEMAATVKEVSHNAKSTSQAAVAATEMARSGSGRVEATVQGISMANDSMRKLNLRAGEIGKITRLIEDVAAQTNILSLNASIEAARAGEQGKGFEVVADEIRKLANRTTRSTGEIAQIIEEIQKETNNAANVMEKGTALAQEAGQSLKDIVEGVVSTTDMVQVISSAAEQQAKTSEEISTALQSISSATQQTSKGAKEVARAIQDLNDMAEGLKQVTDQFTVQ